MPKQTNTPEIKLNLSTDAGDFVSQNTKTARTAPMVAGKAYMLYAKLNTKGLNFVSEEQFLPSITLTTTKNIGETITLWLVHDFASDAPLSFIDYNGNGVKDEGEEVIDGEYIDYTISSQTFKIYGKINHIDASNSNITNLDVSDNPRLRNLFLSNNQLKEIVGLNNVGYLSLLNISNNQFSSLDLSNLIHLRYLSASNTNLKSLKFGEHPYLTSINLQKNKDLPIDNIDFTIFPKLETIDVSSTQLSSLKVPSTLQKLYCKSTNIKGELDLSHLSNLKTLWVENNQITKIHLPSNAPNFSDFAANDCLLTELDLTNYLSLESIKVYNNQLTSLKLPSNTDKLTREFRFYRNKLDASTMSLLMRSVPSIPDGKTGIMAPISEYPDEGNAMPTNEDIQSALDKNWVLWKTRADGSAVKLEPTKLPDGSGSGNSGGFEGENF